MPCITKRCQGTVACPPPPSQNFGAVAGSGCRHMPMDGLAWEASATPVPPVNSGCKKHVDMDIEPPAGLQLGIWIRGRGTQHPATSVRGREGRPKHGQPSCFRFSCQPVGVATGAVQAFPPPSGTWPAGTPDGRTHRNRARRPGLRDPADRRNRGRRRAGQRRGTRGVGPRRHRRASGHRRHRAGVLLHRRGRDARLRPRHAHRLPAGRRKGAGREPGCLVRHAHRTLPARRGDRGGCQGDGCRRLGGQAAAPRRRPGPARDASGGRSHRNHRRTRAFGRGQPEDHRPRTRCPRLNAAQLGGSRGAGRLHRAEAADHRLPGDQARAVRGGDRRRLQRRDHRQHHSRPRPSCG